MAVPKLVSKLIGDKRRWRAYRARVEQLPPNYRDAVEALQRYLMYIGPEDGASAAALFEDLADLFEQAAADGTPIRDVVGADPIEFVEALRRNYPEQGWRDRERNRLRDAVARAAGEHTAGGGGSAG